MIKNYYEKAKAYIQGGYLNEMQILSFILVIFGLLMFASVTTFFAMLGLLMVVVGGMLDIFVHNERKDKR